MKKAIALVLLIIVVSLYSLGKTAPIDERDKWMRDTLELGDSIMATYSSTLDYSPYGQYIAGYITLVGDDSVGSNPDTIKVYNVNNYKDTVLCGLINELGYIDTMAILSSGQEKKFLINDSYLYMVNIIRTNTTNLAARTSYGLLEFSNTAGTWAIHPSRILLVDSVGIVAEVANVSSVDEVDFVDTVRVLNQADNLSSVDEVDFVDTLRVVLKVNDIDTVTNLGTIDTLWAVRTVDNIALVDLVTLIASVNLMDSMNVLKLVDVVTEITNGHIYNSDTTQKKYRDSYTLTSTAADTVWQDTAYGNFRDIYIGYADTGVTTSAGISDSCIVELWDAELSVWKPVGVVNMWNGNHYLYISPGSGLNAEYKIDHYIVDIFRIRFVNTQYFATRTGTVSWTGKGDR